MPVCRCIYALTKLDFVKEESMLAIGLLQPNIDRFSFESGNILALKNKTGKWIKGSALHILFVGRIKHFCQWKSNFSLDLVPLTREAMANAKYVIDRFSEGQCLACFQFILTNCGF